MVKTNFRNYNQGMLLYWENGQIFKCFKCFYFSLQSWTSETAIIWSLLLLEEGEILCLFSESKILKGILEWCKISTIYKKIWNMVTHCQ